MRSIILASNSDRRIALLKQVGIKFTSFPPDINEYINPNISVSEAVGKIAEKKARAALGRRDKGLVVAADTVVLGNDQILAKPIGSTGAKNTLKELSGHWCRVMTGLVLLDLESNLVWQDVVTTEVKIKELSLGEIESYVKYGEPLGKAGSFAIQGVGAVLVERICGNYYNVVGLPLNSLYQGLNHFGYSLWGDLADCST